jgi:hypothetical protein
MRDSTQRQRPEKAVLSPSVKYSNAADFHPPLHGTLSPSEPSERGLFSQEFRPLPPWERGAKRRVRVRLDVPPTSEKLYYSQSS